MTVHKIEPPIVLKKDESLEYTVTCQLSPGEKVISKKELNKKFKCRVCGHDKCEYRFNISSYVCSDCSVVFEDKKKFTVKHVEWGTRDPKLSG